MCSAWVTVSCTEKKHDIKKNVKEFMRLYYNNKHVQVTDALRFHLKLHLIARVYILMYWTIYAHIYATGCYGAV